MGVVYRARDLTLDREVAIKVIRTELLREPAVLERFHREILLASKITHKHILRTHDLVEADGVSFISMQYVDGETLDERLKREGPLPVSQVVPLAMQLCQALQAAHDAGVVHRDLKPQNILIDRGGNPYITDFGISRSLEAGRSMTEHGAVIGTMDYMSPEQARGETVDHRSDIYSLGMLLYQALTGSLPFSGVSALSSIVKRAQEEVPDVRKTRQEAPLWLARILARALRRDPSERYTSAEEMRRDLEREYAPRAWRRLLKPSFVVRGVAALLALALLAVGVSAAMSYMSRRRQAEPVPARASLALLPFANRTGDPQYDWVRTGLPDLLRTDLLQSRELRLTGAERVAGILDGLKLGTGELRQEDVQLVAGLLGVDNVLVGSLFKDGDRFRIEAPLQHVLGSALGGVTPIRVEGTGQGAVFSMVDELTSRIRDDLGLSRRWGEKDRGVTDASTSSVEALRLYADARSHTRKGQDNEAAKLLEAALEADSEFAVARALLAETYSRQGFDEKAVSEAARAAQAVRPTGSPYENARIRGIKARVDHDFEAAEKAYRELVTIAPNDAEAHFGLASVLEEKGDLQGALETTAHLVELDPKDASAHHALGRVHLKLGKTAEGLRELNTALPIYVAAGNEGGRAGVLYAIGYAYHRLSQHGDALRSYKEALAIRERIGDRQGIRACLNNIAVIHRDEGRYDVAVKTAEEALGMSLEMGDRDGQAQVHAIIGDIYNVAGRPEAARASYQASLRLAQETQNETVLSQDVASLGYINSVLGNYTEAMFFLKEALAKRRAIGSKPEILRSLTDLGIVEHVQGRYDEALKHYSEALTIAQEAQEKTAIALLKMNVAETRKEQGEYGNALALLDEAALLAREAEDKVLLASCLAYRGSTLGRAGDHAGASAALEEALGLARKVDNPALTAEFLVYRGELLLGRGEMREAARVLKEAVELAREVQDQRLLLLSRSAAAQAARSTRELETALAALEQAGLTPIAARARVALAQLLLEGGELARAQREAERAIAAAAPLRAQDLLFEAHRLMASSLERQGRTAEAAAHEASALASLEEMHGGLKGPILPHFLARSGTAAFARDAEELFLKANRPTEVQRLRSLLGTHPAARGAAPTVS